MPAPDLDRRDLDLLHGAALQAGEIAMRWFRQPVESWDKQGGQGPVSEADLAVNDMLKAELLAARPDYGWFSEETADTRARLDHERVFIVDPIDGTRAFLAGDSGFCHALAVVAGGEVRAAAVHLPARGETYLALRGGGAVMNGAAISPSRRTEAQGARALITKSQLKSDRWRGRAPGLIPHFRGALIHRLCLIAGGRFDVMLTLRDAYEWDVAAGALIASEAGAQVADSHAALPVFNSASGIIPGIVAGPPPIVGEILRRLGAA